MSRLVCKGCGDQIQHDNADGEDLCEACTNRNARPTPVAPVSPDATGKCGELVTVDDLWDELVNYDDRTSPAEYPDMALITKDELADFVDRSRSQAEELLAAERAKYRDAMEKLVESQRETLVWQQRAIDLKADNAAKDAYGLALMMIREGCKNPSDIARKALERFGK